MIARQRLRNFFEIKCSIAGPVMNQRKAQKTSWAPKDLALRKVQIEQGLVISGALCLFVLQYTNLYERERLTESAGVASYL